MTNETQSGAIVHLFPQNASLFHVIWFTQHMAQN